MSMVSSGTHSAELCQKSPTYIDADAKLRCLRDQMIVEPLPVDHSSILEVIEYVKPLRGVVKVVGPGHYPKRYDHPDKHRRTKMWDSKQFQPTEVKVGDIVELGGYEFGGYGFQQFLWGNKMHIFCREADVSGIVTKEQ